MKLSLFLFLIGAVATADVSLAQGLGKAVVSGVVSDETGQPIPGVTVMATRINEQSEPALAVTEGAGEFRLSDLRPGSYRLEAILDGFQTVSRNVTLVTGQILEIAFKLVPAFSETVEVVARAEQVGEVAILETRRQAPVVSDSISAEEISKTPDADAAGVVERLTGVTLLNNKYVFVRGLGERYSGTTINGATLPTTETEKRVVPLDLFPAKLLQTVNVVKTFTPDKSGDFGSGLVEMSTTEFPGGQTLRLTVGAGMQSSATGEPFRRYAGGLDRLGDGGQPIPSSIPSDPLRRSSALDPSGYTPQELEVFGEALLGQWTGDDPEDASMASNVSLTYGNTFGPVGAVFSVVSNQSFETVDEEQAFFGIDEGGQLVPRNDYDLITDREHTTAGFVGNFSFRLSDTNRVFLSSVMTRDGTAENRFQEGLNTNTGGFIRDYRVRYQLEEMVSTRLRGEHSLLGPGMGSLLDWSVASSEATNESDLRENLYREASLGVFALQAGAAESGKVEFYDLADQIDQGSAAYSIFFTTTRGNRSGLVKLGVDQLKRTRDFGARRFRYSTANQNQFDLTLSPEQIFTRENIRPDGFELREETGVNDAYDAEHTVDALYLMADATLGKWRFIGGARYEDSDQRVVTFNPFDRADTDEAVNVNRNVLPSLNVVYQLESRSNLRLAYGKSLNRPEFRELSPFSFVEVAGGRSIAGNPDLEQATLDSFDARWERFPRPGEVIAASAFYKQIDSPIERIVQPTTELRTSFINADSAELWGLELEFRRALDTLLPALRLWSVNLNYAFIESDVTVGEQQLSVVTNLERPLEGQSDQVANLALQFLHPTWGSMIRLLGAYNGQRLTEVGAFGLPDIYEASYSSVDVVFSQALRFLGKGVELKVSGSNLLDGTREFTQGGEIQRRYEPGRTVSFSLSYSPL